MRRTQHTLDAASAQYFSCQLLTPLLGIWPSVRTCTRDAVIAILTYTAARITSISDACARLRNAPDSDIVLIRLAEQIVDRDILDRRLRQLLQASLPRALRRGKWIIAIDTTLVPYHGESFLNANEVFRSQPKHGTTHFHCYATAFVIRNGLRFTLAILPVTGGTPMHEVVRQHRHRVAAAGVKPRLFLLDRGFNTAGVICYLHAARQPFIMPQAVHGKKPQDGQLTGLRAIGAYHSTGWTTDSWQPPHQRRVSVDLCVLRRRRRNRHGHRTFLYASWGVRMQPRNVYRVYRSRFGIETSYRQMNQLRIRTCTKNPALRLLFVAVALVLRNLWA